MGNDRRARSFSRRRLLAAGGGLGAGLLLPFASSEKRARALAPLVDEGPAFLRGTLEHLVLRDGPGGLALYPTAAAARYTSAPLSLSGAPTHAGLHWLASSEGALLVELRTADARGNWSRWQAVPVDASGAPAAPGDSFGALRYARGAHTLQYRVTFPVEDWRSAWLARMTVALIDSDAPPAASGVAAQAVPVARAGGHLVVPGLASDFFPTPGRLPEAFDRISGADLDLVPRAGWGADESLRKDAAGHELWHEMFVPARLIVVHHTATRNSYDPDEAPAEVRSIYAYHALIQGWWDIGYNALIDRYGVVYEGRHGRGGDPEDRGTPEETLSAGLSAGHAKHHNYGSAGVALLGDSTIGSWDMWDPSGPRWDTLVRYCTFEARRSFLRPLRPGAYEDGSLEPALSDFLRSDDIWHDAAPHLSGHRDFEQTFCPGDPVLALLPELRKQVHEAIPGTSRTGAAISLPAREGAAGAAISWSWQPEEPEPGWSLAGYEYCLEAWFKPETSDDITYLNGYTNDPQPQPVWTALPPSASSVSFTPRQPGQYTLHVRPVVSGAGGVRRAAFAGLSTYLVPRPPADV